MLLRFPELPACEPSQQDVLVRALELVDRRQQFLTITCAERGRLPVDQDGPIGEARRHKLRSCPDYLEGTFSIRFNFSTSVVRFRLSSRAA